MESRLYKKKYIKVIEKVSENDNLINDVEQEVQYNKNDSSWTTIVSKSKPKTASTEKVIDIVTSNQVHKEEKRDKEKETKKELDEKFAKMKSWREARNTVSTEYLKLLCSYTNKYITDKIYSRKHIIDKKTGNPFNYITLSCRAYNENQEPIDVLTENTFKFVLNQFFNSEYFVKQIKEYYKNMGYNVGFKRRKLDSNEYSTYTDLKIYFA